MQNIVFIMADDMGAWALGCAGNPEIRTPSLDRLAATGMRLDNAFCVSPVCSPARASLLTGKIPSQHGVFDYIRRGNSPGESADRAIIDYLADQEGYTDILARHDYVCGLSGKWHLGNAVSPHMGFTFWETHAKGGGPYYNAPLLKNGVEYKEPRYVTDVITDHALTFLKERDRAAPFYLSVHYTAPHSPWDRGQHPAEYFDPYFNDCPFKSTPDLPIHPWQIDTAPIGDTPARRRELLSGYYAAITAMDVGIGRLLDELDRQGLTNDTLIVFTSDNGMNMGHHGIYGKGNGTYPQNLYETSVKVPFIVSSPGRIPSGVTSPALFSHYDFLPTLLDFIGIGGETPAGLPGQSKLGVWLGEKETVDDTVVVFDEYGPARMIRDQRWKYVQRYTDHPDELYDLESDPEEVVNLVNDPAFASRVASMRERMNTWFSRYVVSGRDGSKLRIMGKGQTDIPEKVDVFNDNWNYFRKQP